MHDGILGAINNQSEIGSGTTLTMEKLEACVKSIRDQPIYSGSHGKSLREVAIEERE